MRYPFDLPGSGDTHVITFWSSRTAAFLLWWQFLRVWQCLCAIRSECEQYKTSLFLWISWESGLWHPVTWMSLCLTIKSLALIRLFSHGESSSPCDEHHPPFSCLPPDDKVSLANAPLWPLYLRFHPHLELLLDSRAQGCSFHFFWCSPWERTVTYVEHPGFGEFPYSFVFCPGYDG